MNDDGPDRRQLYWQRQAADALVELIGTSVQIGDEIVRITAQTVAVFRVLAQHVDRHGVCWIGHGEIARRAGVGGGKSRREAIRALRRRHIRVLVAIGAIERLAPGGHGRGSVGAWVVHNLAEGGTWCPPLTVEKGGHGVPPSGEKGGHGVPIKGGRGVPLEEEVIRRRGQQSVPIVENVDDGAWAPMPAGLREWRDGALVKGEASRIVARAAPRAPRPVQPELEPTTPAKAKKAKIPPGSLYAAKLAAAREAFEAAEKIKP